MTPTTAAEALKLSKSGRITHINWNPLDRDYMTFNEDEKVWYNLTTPWESASSLKEKNWLPYDPEPEVDQDRAVSRATRRD